MSEHEYHGWSLWVSACTLLKKDDDDCNEQTLSHEYVKFRRSSEQQAEGTFEYQKATTTSEDESVTKLAVKSFSGLRHQRNALWSFFEYTYT